MCEAEAGFIRRKNVIASSSLFIGNQQVVKKVMIRFSKLDVDTNLLVAFTLQSTKTLPNLFMRNLTLALILMLAGCKNEEVPTPRTFDDVKQDFEAIPTDEGIQDVELELSDGFFWSFRVIPPSTTGSSTYPLILALHGASGGSTTAHQNTDCYVEPGLESLNAFILSPNAGTAEWFELENQEKLFNLLSLALEFWPIDNQKIAVVGYSNGGNASWFYAENQSEFFSAGIPMASSYDVSITDSTSRKIDTPLYVIHGEDDELFPLSQTQTWVEQSVAAGSDITFVVAPTLTHFAPCDYVPYLKDAASWLQDDVWK